MSEPSVDAPVSVCMATHDGERFIRAQLDSILSQLGATDQVVVVDDGSTDSTVAIVRSYDDARIELHAGEAYGGPVPAFARALSLARHDMVVLADQDDVWLPNKLDLVRRLFRDEPERPFLVVLDAEVVDADERLLHPSVLGKLRAGPGFLRNLWTNRYLGCCMAFSRDLLELALPVPPEIPMHDMWLGQLCERVGTTRFVPVVTMRYRRHDTTATGFEIRFEPVQQVLRRWRLTRAVLGRARGQRRRR